MFHIKKLTRKNKKIEIIFCWPVMVVLIYLLINLANRSYPLMLSLWSLTIKRYQFKAMVAC